MNSVIFAVVRLCTAVGVPRLAMCGLGLAPITASPVNAAPAANLVRDLYRDRPHIATPHVDRHPARRHRRTTVEQIRRDVIGRALCHGSHSEGIERRADFHGHER